MKVLFLGTPRFALGALNALLGSRHTVVGVVTQPDRALKHGKSESCAVKLAALSAGLPVVQPQKIKQDVQLIKSFGADIAVTAAYGQILNAEVLGAFKYGVINVHASLLPKYRGASPIQSAIANGEKQTGVTIMRTELGIDTGDILAAEATDIGAGETYGELSERLSEMGGRLLVSVLDGWQDIVPVKQDDALATHCKTISKEQLYIDFSLSAQEVVNRIHALCPAPCAKTRIGGEVYKIYRAAVCGQDVCDTAGKIVKADKKLVIACGVGAAEILTIQAPNKRAMPIADFLNGNRLQVGVICETPQ